MSSGAFEADMLSLQMSGGWENSDKDKDRSNLYVMSRIGNLLHAKVIDQGVMSRIDAYGLSVLLFASIYLTFLLSRMVWHGRHHIGFLPRDSSRLFASRLYLLFSLRVNRRL
jgi:hypothetical protein